MPTPQEAQAADAAWSKQYDADQAQKAQAAQIMWRADPTAVILSPDGTHQYTNPALRAAQ